MTSPAVAELLAASERKRREDALLQRFLALPGHGSWTQRQMPRPSLAGRTPDQRALHQDYGVDAGEPYWEFRPPYAPNEWQVGRPSGTKLFPVGPDADFPAMEPHRPAAQAAPVAAAPRIPQQAADEEVRRIMQRTLAEQSRAASPPAASQSSSGGGGTPGSGWRPAPPLMGPVQPPQSLAEAIEAARSGLDRGSEYQPQPHQPVDAAEFLARFMPQEQQRPRWAANTEHLLRSFLGGAAAAGGSEPLTRAYAMDQERQDDAAQAAEDARREALRTAMLQVQFDQDARQQEQQDWSRYRADQEMAGSETDRAIRLALSQIGLNQDAQENEVVGTYQGFPVRRRDLANVMSQVAADRRAAASRASAESLAKLRAGRGSGVKLEDALGFARQVYDRTKGEQESQAKANLFSGGSPAAPITPAMLKRSREAVIEDLIMGLALGGGGDEDDPLAGFPR